MDINNMSLFDYLPQTSAWCSRGLAVSTFLSLGFLTTEMDVCPSLQICVQMHSKRLLLMAVLYPVQMCQKGTWL